MSKLYGSMDNYKSTKEHTLCGSNEGISAHIRGWNFGLFTKIIPLIGKKGDDERYQCSFSLTGGSNEARPCNLLYSRVYNETKGEWENADSIINNEKSS